MGFTAVWGQCSRDMTGTRVERRRGCWGAEGSVQCLQERHRFVAGRDVFWCLQTRRQHCGCEFTEAEHTLHIHVFFLLCLTECSSESDVCEVMTGLKLAGDRGLSFFLMARICRRALNAVRKHIYIMCTDCQSAGLNQQWLWFNISIPYALVCLSVQKHPKIHTTWEQMCNLIYFTNAKNNVNQSYLISVTTNDQKQWVSYFEKKKLDSVTDRNSRSLQMGQQLAW